MHIIFEIFVKSNMFSFVAVFSTSAEEYTYNIIIYNVFTDDDDKNIGVIVGPIIACIVIVAGIVIAFIVYRQFT